MKKCGSQWLGGSIEQAAERITAPEENLVYGAWNCHGIFAILVLMNRIADIEHFIDQDYSTNCNEFGVTDYNLPLAMYVTDSGEIELRRRDMPDDRLGCFRSFTQNETITFEAWQWSVLQDMDPDDIARDSTEEWHYMFDDTEQPPLRRVVPVTESTKEMMGIGTERSGSNGQVTLWHLSKARYARPLPGNVSVSML